MTLSVTPAEPLIPDPSSFKVEITIAMRKRYKSPGSDQIPAQLIQAGGEILCSKIHKSKSKSKAIPVTGHEGP
jgi:hypothetical protein